MLPRHPPPPGELALLPASAEEGTLSLPRAARCGGRGGTDAHDQAKRFLISSKSTGSLVATVDTISILSFWRAASVAPSASTK